MCYNRVALFVCEFVFEGWGANHGGRVAIVLCCGLHAGYRRVVCEVRE